MPLQAAPCLAEHRVWWPTHRVLLALALMLPQMATSCVAAVVALAVASWRVTGMAPAVVATGTKLI
jgi:hypothetical protein